MKRFDAAVVGAGPAGTACAGELMRLGVDTVILDREEFPRDKLCAGWITPEVMDDLGVAFRDYPGQITRFSRMYFHLYGISLPVKTRQYAIRRQEFDHWLLTGVKAPFYRHKVSRIKVKNGRYLIDGRFSIGYLVGAGGTNCPVYRQLFRASTPRLKKHLVVTMEKEYQTRFFEKNCHLWFFDNHLPGYAWYLPKAKGYLTMGIGGRGLVLDKRGETIHDHFASFADKIEKKGWIRSRPSKAKGYAYYLRDPEIQPQYQNAFLAGDAAGLATRDMGEGIGPAVKSGLLAARSIAWNRPYCLESVQRFSLPRLLLQRFPPMMHPHHKKSNQCPC
ncbi:MAG: NAD(P)/FAD-dependent oxidoreductase [Desulfobacteraceae bacterium]